MRDKCQIQKQSYIYEISAEPKMIAFLPRTAHSRDVGKHLKKMVTNNFTFNLNINDSPAKKEGELDIEKARKIGAELGILPLGLNYEKS